MGSKNKRKKARKEEEQLEFTKRIKQQQQESSASSYEIIPKHPRLTPTEADELTAKITDRADKLLKAFRKLLEDTPSLLDVDYTDPTYDPRAHSTRVGQGACDPRVDLALCLKRMEDDGELGFVKADYRMFVDDGKTAVVDDTGAWPHRIPPMQALGTVDARIDFINKLRRFSSSSSPSWPPPLPPLANPEIESRVFTHRSASKDKSRTYDRLEYLGDSFIHYAITRITYLFFPSADEGALSELRNELVSNSRLASYAELYALDSRLVTAASAARPTSQMAKVRADLFEAYIGGILHDDPIEGAAVAESFLRDLFAPALLTIERTNIRAGKIDNKAKDKLYDLVGGKYQAIAYLDIPSSAAAASGANGDTRAATSGFAVKCVVGNEEIGSGWAMNRADAQARAAMSALRSPSVAGKYRRQKVANLSRHDREAKVIAERQ